MSTPRKITITRKDGTSVTIEDHGETDVTKIVDPEPQAAPMWSRWWTIPTTPKPLIGGCGTYCPHCGTHWPIPWFSVLPPCSCSPPYYFTWHVTSDTTAIGESYTTGDIRIDTLGAK